MDSFGRPRAGFPERTGTVDERGLMLRGELAMAQCPPQCQMDDGLPYGTELLRPRDRDTRREPGQRARPGRRW